MYPPPIKVQFVDNVIGIPSTTRTDMYDSTLDSVIGIQSTTPNTRASIEPTPDFPEYDMKLKHSSEPYEVSYGYRFFNGCHYNLNLHHAELRNEIQNCVKATWIGPTDQQF